MKKKLTFAWIASLFALFVQLLYFIGGSAFTGEWGYAMWSAMVSMVIGVPSVLEPWKQHKI
ncbi:hypothetical protein M1E11_09585 [Bacillus sp. JZ8]